MHGTAGVRFQVRGATGVRLSDIYSITCNNSEYSHRLRVGDWRILFNVLEEISIANIEEVKKRDESTY